MGYYPQSMFYYFHVFIFCTIPIKEVLTLWTQTTICIFHILVFHSLFHESFISFYIFQRKRVMYMSGSQHMFKEKGMKNIPFLVSITNCLAFCKMLSKQCLIYFLLQFYGVTTSILILYMKKMGLKQIRRKGQNPNILACLSIWNQYISFYLLFGTV